jgi:hypothetical protein
MERHCTDVSLSVYHLGAIPFSFLFEMGAIGLMVFLKEHVLILAYYTDLFTNSI